MKKAGSYIVTALGIVLAGGGLSLIKSAGVSEGIMTTVPYLMVGVGCGIFGGGVGSICNRVTLSNHPEIAKQKEIEEKDERNIMIANAARSKGFQMMTFVFGGLMLAFALMGASFTILISLVAAYLFVQFYTIYCHIKMNNEQ